jgi:superfamily II DNA or RNA helicase
MAKVKITVKDEITSVIHGLTKEHSDYLWKQFGPMVEAARFTIPFKLGRWDGCIRFFERTGKTYTKLLSQLIPYIDKWGYDIELEDNRPYYEGPLLIAECPFPNKEIKLRPYQVQGSNLAIEAGGGALVLATGAGKSLITGALSHAYSSIGYNTLTIVPSSDLVNQTADFYRMAGLDTGIYSGNKKDLHHINVVATWQSLQNHTHIMSQDSFRCIIWDEMHGVKATVATKLMNEHAVDIPFKFGVTGTFPKVAVDKLTAHSVIGDILFQVPARWLMDRGYLTPVEIELVKIKQKLKIAAFPDYGSERTFLSKNEDRMDVIADLIIHKSEEIGNTLVLVNSVSFGEKLAGKIEGAVFLYGGSATAERKSQYDTYASCDDVITIATFGIASTGISIDRVKCLMFVDAGKSFVRTIQSVGRSLRLSSDKKVAHVVDVYGDLKWSKKHAKERQKWYLEADYPVVKSIDIVI